MRSPVFALAYPDIAAGYVPPGSDSSKDWKAARIRTPDTTLDALGLNQAFRGARIDEDRPDLILLDDIEEESDTPYMTAKKTRTVSKTIIGAGAPNLGVAFYQNQIHPDSIMAQMCDGRADFLGGRKVVGPIPQIHGLKYETEMIDGQPYHRIISGEADWEALDLETSERELNEMGPLAFEAEKQHTETTPDGSMFPRDSWIVRRVDPTAMTWRALTRAWDFAGTKNKDSDWTCGVLVGLDIENRIWIIHCDRMKEETGEVSKRVVKRAARDDLDFNIKVTQLLEQQPGEAGLRTKASWNKRLMGHVVKWIRPTGSKVERARPYAGAQQNLLVHVIDGEWRRQFVTEHAGFPAERTGSKEHDDTVDGGAMGYNDVALAFSQASVSGSSVGQRIDLGGYDPRD